MSSDSLFTSAETPYIEATDKRTETKARLARHRAELGMAARSAAAVVNTTTAICSTAKPEPKRLRKEYELVYAFLVKLIWVM